MTPNEIKDYELLNHIQKLCDDAKAWDGPCDFQEIREVCSMLKMHIKNEIGHRIIAQYESEKIDECEKKLKKHVDSIISAYEDAKMKMTASEDPRMKCQVTHF